MKTYTAQVGPKNAKRLAELPEAVAGTPAIEDIGGGTVQINDLDRLRTLAPDADGVVTDDADGLQIWIDGEGFPIFDGSEAAVADALGMQTNYLLAKHGADHARDLYAAAVATVVDLAGSAGAAADLIGIDVAEVEQLVPAAVTAPVVAPPVVAPPAPVPDAPVAAPTPKVAKKAKVKTPKTKTAKAAAVPVPKPTA
jgi:hypothetical protein